jgi:mono/diheme cytochrome c family protein
MLLRHALPSLFVLPCLLISPAQVAAANAPAQASAAPPAADIKPALRVLRDECVGCHKPGKAKGGLLLTTHEKMM